MYARGVSGHALPYMNAIQLTWNCRLSYLGSVVVTVLQLSKDQKSVSSTGDGHYSGHVEEDIPTATSWVPRVDQPRPMPFERMTYGEELPETNSNSQSSSSRTTLPPPTTPSSREPKYANMPAGIVESMALAISRVSMETTSSMDPDHYIVSDGFRPSGRPPSYRSSRESSLGPPEYRSRPPSLHAVVMGGPGG